MIARRHLAASRMLVRPLHRFQLSVDVEFLAGFEHQHFHALRGEHVRGHAARGARSDDDGVVGRLQVDFGCRRLSESNEHVITWLPAKAGSYKARRGFRL